MSFRVDLNTFRGPLDLLLYLVRKHELPVTDLPIAEITQQYLTYLEVLEDLNIDKVGDFLEMASTLIEIKSRMVLPREDESTDEEIEDPREGLVERLLEYKQYKDAANMLEEQSVEWQQRFPRLADDLPPRKIDLSEQPIHEVELWDLVSAFGRIMRDNQTRQPSNIVYDDTPIHVYITRIHTRLASESRVALSTLFQKGMHKSAMIGVFLAMLELVRHHGVRTEQTAMHGEIWIIPGADFGTKELDLSNVDDYGGNEADEPEPEEDPSAVEE